MSEGIIEILQHKMSDGQCAFFVASNLVNSVELTVPAGDIAGQLRTIDDRNIFNFGENYIILSMGCLLPLSFQFWSVNDDARVGFSFWINEGGTVITNRQRRLEHIWVPFGSYEMSLGMYFPGSDFGEATIDDDFEIRAKFFDKGGNFPHISMLNLPDSLHEQKFYVPIFIKVLHTYGLGAVV